MKPMYAPYLLLTICWLWFAPQSKATFYDYSLPTIACNDTVRISVDLNCEALIDVDDLLEGPVGDPADYQILIESGPNAIPNPVPADYLGLTLIATATYIPDGNSCWSVLITEDKTGPEILCPTDTISIWCWENVNQIPAPVAVDNCTPTTLQQTSQQWTDNEICDQNGMLLTRFWTAFDDFGNEAAVPCKQYIHLDRPLTINFPNDITWSCTQFDAYPGITEAESLHPDVLLLQQGNTPIDASGITDPIVLENTGSGSLTYLNFPVCNYGVTYSDHIIETCGNDLEIVRTWTVTDWCTGNIITENDEGEDNYQVISIMDVTPPEMVIGNQYTIPVDTSTICLSQDSLPLPFVIEDCNTYELRIYTSIGEAIYENGNDATGGAYIPPPGLPPGAHTLLYQATNACGLVSELEVSLEIHDPIAPVTFCDEITDVSLNAEGLAEVEAAVFNDGTYDNCCLDEFLVRRMDTACPDDELQFQPTVSFCCEDIENSPVMVTFRALDCYENFNECMVQVYVEDKLPVSMQNCPAGLTITCHEYEEDLALPLSLDDFSVLEVYGAPSFFG